MTKLYAVYGASGCGRSLMPVARQQLARESDASEIVFIDAIGGTGPGTGETETVNASMVIKEFDVVEDTTFTLNDIITIIPDHNTIFLAAVLFKTIPLSLILVII